MRWPVAACLLVAACQRPPDPGVAAGSGSPGAAPVAPAVAPLAAAEGSAVAIPTADVLRTMPAPVVDDAARRCRVDTDCRVHQPSDWSAAVECCYDYGCSLEYEAVNLGTWRLVQAWRRANAFDCVAHVRDKGPCPSETARCGLAQEPPPAACVEQQCRVAWPERWPVVDAQAQRCEVDADCTSVPASSTAPAQRCCPDLCSSERVAVNRSTAQELDAWKAAHTGDCEAWRTDNRCPPTATCAGPRAVPACVGGLCALEAPPGP
jgi:hypothetical protein